MSQPMIDPPQDDPALATHEPDPEAAESAATTAGRRRIGSRATILAGLTIGVYTIGAHIAMLPQQTTSSSHGGWGGW